MKIKSIFIVIIVLISCSNLKSQKKDVLGLEIDKRTNSKTKVPATLKEDYSCMNDVTGANQGIDLLNSFDDMAINALGVDVTVQEENDFGDKYYQELQADGKTKFITLGAQIDALKQIMNDLLSCRNKPTGLKYTMHLIDKDEVNAFTCGGHIFVYTGIIKYLKTQSELAFIIGHEIGHNEKGHIQKMIKQLKIARGVAGEFGDVAFALKKFMFPVFNQHNEIEVDFYGVDLAYASGYTPCKGIQVWSRMSKDEGNYDVLQNFLRSHPYSSVRFSCLTIHIKDNYATQCKEN